MRYTQAVIVLLALVLAASAWAETPTQAWRAPDGATLWRGQDWELLDADGDGDVEAAVFFAGGQTARVELDVDNDGAADRVYLFHPEGQSTGYLDTDNDGVLEEPAGPPNKQRKQLHELGRGGALFKKALEMRFAADAGDLPQVDAPPPNIAPPLQRQPGPKVKVQLRMSLLPGAPAPMLHRDQAPAHLGDFSFSTPAGIGVVNKTMKIKIRTDPTEQTPPVDGTLSLSCYPVFVRENRRGETKQTLVLQVSGRLKRAGISDQTFFFTIRLSESPSFAHVPVRDAAGRPAGQILIEITTNR